MASKMPSKRRTKPPPLVGSISNVHKTTETGDRKSDRSNRSMSERSLHTVGVSAEGLFYYEDEGAGEEEHSFTLPKPHTALSRTSLLLEDYRQFKAARVIQTAARGWIARHMFKKKRHAAIVIQSNWRCFWAKRFYFIKLESKLQEHIWEYYHRSATKIQALWRGWWVREYIHDHHRLNCLQVMTAADLLHCVAFKLHHLLRTHQIPGVYSLRNSTCLSKIEKLLVAMSFKQHNQASRNIRTRREAEVHDAKKQFSNSKYNTVIPYSGPNFAGVCEPKCCAFYDQTDLDRKMYKILELYQKASSERLKTKRRYKSKIKNMFTKDQLNPKIFTGYDFCTEIVMAMKRWSVLRENKITVDPNIFKQPKKLDAFLDEIASIYDLLQERCHCRLRVGDLKHLIKEKEPKIETSQITEGELVCEDETALRFDESCSCEEENKWNEDTYNTNITNNTNNTMNTSNTFQAYTSLITTNTNFTNNPNNTNATDNTNNTNNTFNSSNDSNPEGTYPSSCLRRNRM